MSPEHHHQLEILIEYVYQLHDDAVIYHRLFVLPASIELLNRRNGRLLRHFQIAMQDRMLLGIARLFDEDDLKDRMTLTRHEVVSLRRAIAHLPDESSGKMMKDERRKVRQRRDSLLRGYDAAKSLCAPIIDHRHQRIAHNDARVYTGKKFLPAVNRSIVDQAIKRVASLVSGISEMAGFGIQDYFEEAGEHDFGPECDEFLNLLTHGNIALDKRHDQKRTIIAKLKAGVSLEGALDKLRELSE